ncbi:NRPS-like enzyme [Mycena floridula]|nr:NRPS-like enzyme [Mycena floridula]
MSFITLQGQESSTFVAPPTDMSLTIAQIFEFHAKNSPKHPVFRYQSLFDDSISDVVWSEVIQAIHKAGRIVSQQAAHHESRIIGILVASGKFMVLAYTMTTFALICGIMRAGFAAFPISPRISAAAVAHLLENSKCTSWFVASDSITQTLARDALKELEQKDITQIPLPSFDELFGEESVEPLPAIEKAEWDSLALVMHSSGSSTMPKVIPMTHRVIMLHGLSPCKSDHGELDLCGEILSIHMLPMYRTSNLWHIYNLAMTGVSISVYPPRPGSFVPNPDHVLRTAVATRTTFMFCVPAFLEHWSRSSDDIVALKQLKAVYAGGPLKQEVGDLLVAHNINPIPVYGLTEIGAVSAVFPAPSSKEDWNWVQFGSNISPILVPVEGEDNLYRLCVKNTETTALSLVNCVIDGADALDTQDLVMMHPSNPKLFRVFGRHDDQISHSTGEKTNPVPIENMLVEDPLIHSAVMFGREQFSAGVIITPILEEAFDPKDEQTLENFRNKIWRVFWNLDHSLNTGGSSHVQMILVADPAKPFTYTAKATIRRQAILDSYAHEIRNAYDAVASISHTDQALSVRHNLKDITHWVRDLFRKIIGSHVKDTEDLFSLGGDSLSAISIRNSILIALRASPQFSVSSLRALPPNLVYECSSVATMSAFLYGFTSSNQEETQSQLDIELEQSQFDWDSPTLSSSTIVKLRKGNGETPLIVLPGAGGSAIDLKNFPETFRTAVWAIQITDETPQTSLQDQASFIYKRIKLELPLGPYRLASYSGSSILVIMVAKLFEAGGDQVIQLAMLDHFPTCLVAPGMPLVSGQDPVTRANTAGEGIARLMRRDSAATVPHLHKIADELEDAFRGKEVSDLILKIHHKIFQSLILLFNFVGSVPTEELMIKWARDLKAPITVFVAKKGVVTEMPQGLRGERADLGARKCYPEATVIEVEGGHWEFLEDPTLLKGLQRGYY